MFFQLISRIVCTSCGFIYPAYASYKAIKSNDLQKLEVALMYWVVMGTVMTMESTVEWFFAWFPFYYEIKTVVVLWLTLPQVQGSTYIYLAHIHPFLTLHETEIDAALANAKVRAKQAGLEWLNKAVQRLRAAVMGTVASQYLAEGIDAPTPPDQEIRQPPTLADPVSGATAQLYSLAGHVMRQYGPAALAAGSALLHPMSGRAPSVRSAPTAGEHPSDAAYFDSASSLDGTTTGRTASFTKAQARTRRAELQAQLAAFDVISSGSGSASPPPSSSGSSQSQSAFASPSRSPVYPYPTQPQHPRSVSASAASGQHQHPSSLVAGGSSAGRNPSPSGGPAGTFSGPRDPVAARIERSFLDGSSGGNGSGSGSGSFEEIERDEVGEYYAQQQQLQQHAMGGSGDDVARRSGQGSPSSAEKKGGWWFWAGQPTGELQGDGVSSERKNA